MTNRRRRRWLRASLSGAAIVAAWLGSIEHARDGGWSIEAGTYAHAGCAYFSSPGRFCRDVAEHCTPGCSPTSCAERVKILTTQAGSTQYVTFFEGAVKRCSQAGSRTQIFECAWGQVGRTYPDLASDQCSKNGLWGTFDSIAFNRSLRAMDDNETCEPTPTDGSVPPDYAHVLQAPRRFLDGGDRAPVAGSQFNVPPGHNIGANEGRLISQLRQVARVADPLNCALPLAAKQFALAQNDSDRELAQAFADLSVTGHMAWLGRPARPPNDPVPARAATNGFKRDAPGLAYCQALPAMLPNTPPRVTVLDPYQCPSIGGRRLQAAEIVDGCKQALTRAYKVARFLRGGARGDLQWIAVSGEDDSPHRPVNVARSPFPQFDVFVDVLTPFAKPTLPQMVPVRSRFTVAQFRPPRSKPTRRGDLTPNDLTIPPDPVLAIAPDAEILLFVHGMDSRAEEADDLTKTLFRHLTANHSTRNITIVSVDLPTSGYAENIDYERVSPLDAIGVVKGDDFHASGDTPLLDFIENFVVGFVNQLETMSPGAKSKIKAVMGGSLGGNITFRLGRRAYLPWLPRFVVWSPASIWDSLAGGADLTKHVAVNQSFKGANTAHDPSDPDHLVSNAGRRAEFFLSWDKPIFPVLVPMAQSDTWQSDHYPCKRSLIAAARLDREETYDPRFLAWHWRLATEQLIYSHQAIEPTTGEPRFKSNTKRMLLMCGVEDNITYNDICGATQRTAPHMTTTPGRALFLEKTGHSLDNERRDFVADQILAFLDEQAPAGPLAVGTVLPPPPPPPPKKALGELCVQPSDCQSNRCTGLPLRCEAQPPPGKLSNGQPCLQPSDCQSNRCVVTCQAQPEKKQNGLSCVKPDECLSNWCSGLPLKCRPAPVRKPNGQGCLSPAECQSNRCSGFPLRCEPQP